MTDRGAADGGRRGTPSDFGPIQAPRQLGIAAWQFGAAVRRGLIPAADHDGRWPAELITAAGDLLPQILEAVGDQPPVGARRAAERIGQRLGLDVDGADVDELACRGLLAGAGEYKDWPLYDAADLDQLADSQAGLIKALAADRRAWVEASLDPRAARERLGWNREEFGRVTAGHGISPGRFGRYPSAVIDALAADPGLDARVRGARLVGADQAAGLLEVRRTDFDYCAAAGWITPAAHAESRVSGLELL